MTPIVQIMMGVGIGLLGLFFLAPLAVGYYGNSHSNSNNSRKNKNYWTLPDQACPICLDTLDNESMTYLKCGHALHDSCLNNLRRTSSQCPVCRDKF